MSSRCPRPNGLFAGGGTSSLNNKFLNMHEDPPPYPLLQKAVKLLGWSLKNIEPKRSLEIALIIAYNGWLYRLIIFIQT